MGLKAFDRSANREAVAFFEQALGALQHLPERRDTLEQAIDLRIDLRNSLTALGEFGRLGDYLREAETLAEALGDDRRAGRVAAYLSPLFSLTGDYARGLESGRRALVIGDATDDLGIRVTASFYLGLASFYRGDHGRAIAFQRQIIRLLDGDSNRERFGLQGLPAVFGRAYLAITLAEMGQFAEGIATGEEAIRIAEVVNHQYSQILAETGLGYLYVRAGEFERAIGLLEEGVRRCQAIGIRVLFPLAAAILGAAYVSSQRLREAIPLLERARAAAESMRVTMYQSALLGLLGEAYLLADRTDHASEAAQRALDFARADRQQGFEAWALRLLGEISLHRHPPKVQSAEHSYRRAMALANELGMRPLVGHCHLGLGKLYRRIDHREQAHEHLTTAATMYREMDMRFWLEQAEAE